MSGRTVITGNEDFREVRENNLYYVDKTSIIKDIVESMMRSKVFLFTRPRRFGKTLTMIMLREFFDVTHSSKELFDGLAISYEQEICKNWMNSNPVIFCSLKDIKASSATYTESYDRFCSLASRLCLEHNYLLESNKIPDSTKKRLSALMDGTASYAAVSDVLLTLSCALHQHWNKKTIILVDEYDAPLASVQAGQNYDRLVSFIGNMLETGFKTNPSLAFSVMTGCLRIAKESVYTGLNHVDCYGIDHVLYADKFGFTPEEVETLLAEQNLSHKADEIRAWYNGYCFGSDQQIYCPWDVVKYVADLGANPKARPLAYWSNTSSNDITRKCISQREWPIEKALSTLMQGGCIETTIADSMTYDSLTSTESTLWTLLYLTGYLTKLPDSQQDHDTDLIKLHIPNKEIRTIFARDMDRWLNEAITKLDLTSFFTAFWAGDEKAVTNILSDIILDTVSVFDAYKEDYYHAFIHAIFYLHKYEPISNGEKGHGFADIVVDDIKDKKSSRSAVIEVKRADSPNALEHECAEALAQIERQKYDQKLLSESRTILHWGIAFRSKYCLAKCKTIRRPDLHLA